MTDDNTNNQSIQDLSKELEKLEGEVKNTIAETHDFEDELEKDLGDLDAKVEKASVEVDQICSDLDKIEEESGNELDKIALEQAEDLAEEE